MQHNNNIKPHHRQLRRRTQSRLPHQPREMVHKTEPEKKRSSTSIPPTSVTTPTDFSSPSPSSSPLTPPHFEREPLTPPKTDDYNFASNSIPIPTSISTGISTGTYIPSPIPTEFVVLNFIRQRQEHKLSDQSLELVVTRLEYRRLLAELELSELKGFVDDKLR